MEATMINGLGDKNEGDEGLTEKLLKVGDGESSSRKLLVS
jgi:hypothetical protein